MYDVWGWFLVLILIMPMGGLSLSMPSRNCGRNDACLDSDVLMWLWLGANHTSVPPCLKADVAELLAEEPAMAAEVLARWTLPGSRWFGAPSVNRIEMFSVPVKFFNNDPTPDIVGAATYNLDKHRVPRGGLVVEVGSHVGMVAIMLSKLNPEAHVIAFEPSLVNRFFVELNLAMNHVKYFHSESRISSATGIVEVRGEAISGNEGQASFQLSPDADCSKIRSGTIGNYPVRTRTISSILSETGAEKIDFMKIDCEGCEWSVVDKMDGPTYASLNYVTGEYHPEFMIGDIQSGPDPARVIGMMCANRWHMQHLLCLPSPHYVLQKISS